MKSKKEFLREMKMPAKSVDEGDEFDMGGLDAVDEESAPLEDAEEPKDLSVFSDEELLEEMRKRGIAADDSGLGDESLPE